MRGIFRSSAKMKHWVGIFTLTIISCNSRQEKVSSSGTRTSAPPTELTDTKPQARNEICWKGNLNGKTSIFIHYQLDSNLIIGEITYLDTKNKTPIKLLGTIDNEDKSYRLQEFDKTGNITGVISGQPSGRNFSGSWVSPKTEKELVMILTLKDTLINSPDIKTDENQIFGNYHYQYSEKGYAGDF